VTVRISDAEIDSIRKRFRARLVAELAPLLGADGDVSTVDVEAARLATRSVADEMFAGSGSFRRRRGSSGPRASSFSSPISPSSRRPTRSGPFSAR
jgi:hypothetical protein